VHDALEGAVGVVLGVSGRWLVWVDRGGDRWMEGGMEMGVVGKITWLCIGDERQKTNK
jgi:hypothetical protein